MLLTNTFIYLAICVMGMYNGWNFGYSNQDESNCMNRSMLCVCMYVYIYIYIYGISHKQTDFGFHFWVSRTKKKKDYSNGTKFIPEGTYR